MWIHLPTSVYTAEAADLTSALSWPFQVLEQSVTWKEMRRRSRSWLTTCNRSNWMMRLSGQIPEPSTAPSGVAKWIGSLAASPASRGQSQGDRQGWTMSVGSGPISDRFLGMFNPEGRFLKTSRDFFEADSDPSSVTLPRSGSMRSGQVFERQTLAHRTGGNGYSFWATPTASDDEHKVTVNSLQPGLVGEVDRFSGRPVQEALKIGGKLSKSDQTSLPRLNPKFVELLMGWPQGWLELTGSASSGTE